MVVKPGSKKICKSKFVVNDKHFTTIYFFDQTFIDGRLNHKNPIPFNWLLKCFFRPYCEWVNNIASYIATIIWGIRCFSPGKIGFVEINVKTASAMFMYIVLSDLQKKNFFFLTGNLLVSSVKKWFDCFWQLKQLLMLAINRQIIINEPKW